MPSERGVEKARLMASHICDFAEQMGAKWKPLVHRDHSEMRDAEDVIAEQIARALDAERANECEEAASFTEEAVLNIECTALEAEGPVRRTRGALARCFRARAAALREEGNNG
jgi:hypothetical protein